MVMSFFRKGEPGLDQIAHRTVAMLVVESLYFELCAHGAP